MPRRKSTIEVPATAHYETEGGSKGISSAKKPTSPDQEHGAQASTSQQVIGSPSLYQALPANSVGRKHSRLPFQWNSPTGIAVIEEGVQGQSGTRQRGRSTSTVIQSTEDFVPDSPLSGQGASDVWVRRHRACTETQSAEKFFVPQESQGDSDVWVRRHSACTETQSAEKVLVPQESRGDGDVWMRRDSAVIETQSAEKVLVPHGSQGDTDVWVRRHTCSAFAEAQSVEKFFVPQESQGESDVWVRRHSAITKTQSAEKCFVPQGAQEDTDVWVRRHSAFIETPSAEKVLIPQSAQGESDVWQRRPSATAVVDVDVAQEDIPYLPESEQGQSDEQHRDPPEEAQLNIAKRLILRFFGVPTLNLDPPLNGVPWQYSEDIAPFVVASVSVVALIIILFIGAVIHLVETHNFPRPPDVRKS